MPIITGRKNVLAIYEEAAKRGWVIPCLCSENLTTTEAILTAASEFATEKGYDRIPVTLAITNQYDHRSQSVNYTCTRRWDIGLALFRSDLEIVSQVFPNVDVLIHPEDTQKAVERLEGELWRREGDVNFHDVSLYSPTGTHLELHFNLRENLASLDPLLDRVWEHACPAGEREYGQSDAFLLFHLFINFFDFFFKFLYTCFELINFFS